MNKTEIVFSYAGDLWSVPREGGVATRLTAGAGMETEAAFSPDGNTIAFSGEYDGNTDVFTVPAAGGVPKRVTYHPDADRVVGWTPDGKRILFRSNRLSYSRYNQLFTVSPEGGLPDVLPLPMATFGAYSPDGKHMVYAPLDGGQFATGFTNFRGLEALSRRRSQLSVDGEFGRPEHQKIPRTDSNDINPMWIGDKIYFLSDRNGPHDAVQLRSEVEGGDRADQEHREGLSRPPAPVPAASFTSSSGRSIFTTSPAGRSTTVPIQIDADLAEVRPHFQNVAREIRNAANFSQRRAGGV
jgi:tricorn protease